MLIPAYNEEMQIRSALQSVRQALGGRAPFEVIVIDDGSTDQTVSIAQSEGASIVVSHSSTIGGSRNEGAAVAAGEVLVFLDADVTVTDQWGSRLLQILPELRRTPGIVTGDMCAIPADSGWIERAWFGRRIHHATHVGSGHMIINATFFRKIGGFDPSLYTGEDYELSARVRRHGGEIRPDPMLRAIHHGFPKTVGDFLRREIWHGAGDSVSLAATVRSRVATAAVLFLILHVLIVVGLVTGSGVVVAGSAAGLMVLLAVASLQKFGVSDGNPWLRVTFLYYVYFWGRAFALLGVKPGQRPSNDS